MIMPDVKTIISIGMTNTNKLSLNIDYDSLAQMDNPDTLYSIIGIIEKIKFSVMAIIEGQEIDNTKKGKDGEITDADINNILGESNDSNEPEIPA